MHARPRPRIERARIPRRGSMRSCRPMMPHTRKKGGRPPKGASANARALFRRIARSSRRAGAERIACVEANHAAKPDCSRARDQCDQIWRAFNTLRTGSRPDLAARPSASALHSSWAAVRDAPGTGPRCGPNAFGSAGIHEREWRNRDSFDDRTLELDTSGRLALGSSATSGARLRLIPATQSRCGSHGVSQCGRPIERRPQHGLGR